MGDVTIVVGGFFFWPFSLSSHRVVFSWHGKRGRMKSEFSADRGRSSGVSQAGAFHEGRRV